MSLSIMNKSLLLTLTPRSCPKRMLPPTGSSLGVCDRGTRALRAYRQNDSARNIILAYGPITC
eukprot:scaffold239607_cov28-Prasinocladus_malaysianus.AAC.1